MKHLAFFIGVAVCTASAHAITLYDALNQSSDISNSTTSWDGGNAVFGTNYGIQVAQRITDAAGGSTITQVTGRYVTYHDAIGIDSALVQVYNVSGDTVGSLVGQGTGLPTISSLGQVGTSSFFMDDITLNVSIGGLTAGNEYVVTIQPHSTTDYGGLLYTNTSAHDNFWRDYTSYGYSGRLGHTELTSPFIESGMRVIAVPEPSVLAAVGLGLCLVVRRNRNRTLKR